MVIDTSAIFAAIANEPDGAIYRDAIKVAPVRVMSAITLLETRNIVDCAAYALSRSRNLPLLFKGNDFSPTDIRSALPLNI